MLKFRLRRVLAACAVIIFSGTLLGTFHEGTAVIPRWTSGKFQSVYDPPRLHPIEIISSRQRNEFEKFTKSQSRTFKEAVNKYRVKYKRNPPPGFLQWYRYAKSLHATIIDDFDQIYNDLEPFWGIEPEVLRGRINGLFKLDSVEKISIRNGTLVECTGDWRLLLEGHELLQDLPDMDIAANGLDEPRIIASWDKRKEALDIAAHHNTSQVQKTEWSRINFDIPAEEIELSEYKQRTPHDLFADACPPDSGLRVDDHVLTDDIEFVEGTQAFDLCNLPSFDHLHGFGFAPASFIVSTTLAPIFSQAKLSFVSDILFPSPMFVTHADDDSSLFLEKRDQMVWRGSTTGTSNDANWRQSHRARLMSMVYSDTSLAPLLVNDTETRLPTPALKEVLCDVGFTGMIQCETSTCDEMKEEFGTVSRLTYEEIVRFKYLLILTVTHFHSEALTFIAHTRFQLERRPS